MPLLKCCAEVPAPVARRLLATNCADGVDDARDVATDGEHEAEAELDTATEAPPNAKGWDEVRADAGAELVASAWHRALLELEEPAAPNTIASLRAG
eukprot:CAMPEP_0179074892 /NCGR_PEP_ID=MMETSP0796-20121207/33317_1 /TAXON_ID=73915 /ORGANISM="Pyrodinium bahamense, Strain pbaha01" /LENGTH=96 /DNA_ID=CAMNT_0020772123 /DNA_START=94 /DNA_END=384 /DNA_ORIENTATION=+